MKDRNTNDTNLSTNGTNEGLGMDDGNILYMDLSYRIMECAFEVHNVLGPGFPEKIYEGAFITELKVRGIAFERQKQIEVPYKGEIAGDFRLDLIIENSVVVEIKAVSELTDIFEAQLLSYLKATRLNLGILINFGGTRVEYKRLAN